MRLISLHLSRFDHLTRVLDFVGAEVTLFDSKCDAGFFKLGKMFSTRSMCSAIEFETTIMSST